MRKVSWFAFIFLFIVVGIAVAQEEAPEPFDPLNAVVKIETQSYVPNYFIPWQDHGQQSGSGSGVVIHGNLILTNAHVLDYSTYITVRKQSNDSIYEATIKAIDHDCDLALLEVKDKSFFLDIQPFEIGQTPPVQTQVLVAGYPIGGDAISFTQGVISRIEVHTYTHSLKSLLAAQLDAAINPGNSGGPVICNGEIAGIAFQGDPRGEGLGYMIPTDIIRHFLKDLEDGKVDGFSSVNFRCVMLENPDTRAFLKMSEGQTGIRIVEVASVYKDVLKVDDVLLKIDGVPVANNGNIRLNAGEPRLFTTLFTQKQLGETISLTLLRDGKEIQASLPLSVNKFKGHGYLYDLLPEYFIIGGFVFTPLSFSLLDEWTKGNPPEELTRAAFQDQEQDDEEVIVLTTVLADRVNLGNQHIRAAILKAVDGKPVKNLRDLIDRIDNSQETYVTFSMHSDDTEPVTLNLKKLKEQTPAILARYRVPADRSLRTEQKP